MDATIPTYTYEPLDEVKNEIRLLHLDEAGMSYSAPPRLRVSQVALDTNPNYVALSYVWGDPTVVKSIFLDDKEFKVTVNLFEVLQRLSSTLFNHNDKGAPMRMTSPVWIDAISINMPGFLTLANFLGFAIINEWKQRDSGNV
jgi:hypothetical protein